MGHLDQRDSNSQGEIDFTKLGRTPPSEQPFLTAWLSRHAAPILATKSLSYFSNTEIQIKPPSGESSVEKREGRMVGASTGRGGSESWDHKSACQHHPTACFAETWQSKGWALFSAAQMQNSIALPASESKRMWGSPFWAAVAELSANGHCATFHPDLIHPQDQYFNTPLSGATLHPLPLVNRFTEEVFDNSDSSDESHRDELDNNEVDSDAFEVWVTQWETKTRPLNVSIGDRHALFSSVENFRAGQVLMRPARSIFKQRAAVD
ncbi:hypothetical protein MVEN_01895600 [Mycena venus]|uniref:Uncharacterized protein n=1 Tax=Mycena venus TaxID=2733690 RepID=A0A8H7CKS3_9AGAR|nr:hypothetical protein MVEN_01895600 [Mycena venus]